MGGLEWGPGKLPWGPNVPIGLGRPLVDTSTVVCTMVELPGCKGIWVPSGSRMVLLSVMSGAARKCIVPAHHDHHLHWMNVLCHEKYGDLLYNLQF